jgi:hypothetical protein
LFRDFNSHSNLAKQVYSMAAWFPEPRRMA